ncbi:multidrug transporter [Urechidicola croceus]|uniref:Multidrug transporter n=1 Tax=Urechidicola croceus TaxID=1850246 RepID=A0A1D8P8X5_9FLAO|nr:multidrug transporter [Urechidicola croceus]AOW21012.1 multidrug transporter [Urechidicola croceus]
MKKTILSLALMSTILISCGDDDTADIIINDNSVTTTNNTTNGGGDTDPQGQDINLSGTYVDDLTLDPNNNYTINGPMIMASGTTLTIPACMTIEALAAGSDVYLAIAQGAKIVANGTADCPIVFTSNASAPAAGDWGGLILLGKAPINSVTGGTATATSEIGGLPYGGDIEADDSGSLSYVRVQYSGGKADGQSENNGFSFYGVGSGTTVNHVQMFEGLDDGFEFFGGTVNVDFLSAVNAQDDSIDWTEGYSGTITNAYVKHGAEHDKGIEADGYNTDIGNNSNPLFWSAPTVENLTIEGLGSATGNEAIRLRAGTRITIINAVVEGFEEGIDMDGDDTDNPTGEGVTSGETTITDITFTDVITKLKNDTGVSFTEADLISGDGNGTGTDYATWGAGWTVE